MAFTGFSTDGLLALPPELFTQVLPAISLPSELKVTLHIFYRLNRQRGQPRRLSWDELAADTMLTQSLRAISKLRTPAELLDEGLDAAVQRGTLLHLALPATPTSAEESRLVNWYLVNTAANRAWVAELASARAALTPNQAEPEPRPSLLTLYEQNIGLVTPLLVDELREAEERYPPEWIEAALREAVRANARSWRYVRKVLERWATHGRHTTPHQPERRAEEPFAVERYLKGPYGHLFQRGDKPDDES